MSVTLDNVRTNKTLVVKFSTVLFLLFSSGIVRGQDVFNPTKIRKSILALSKQLSKYNDSSVYLQITYDTIFSKATEKELYELTNHPNPLVRRSSFYCLLDRYSPKVISLLKKNANDTTQYFTIQYGCFVERHTFVDELLFFLSPQSGWDRNFEINLVQKQTVLAMIQKREKDKQQRREKELEKELQEYMKNH